MANPLSETRTQVAALVGAVPSAGSVVSRQFYTPDWQVFGSMFDFETVGGDHYLRGWMVMPSPPQAQTREHTVGMSDVKFVTNTQIVVRGFHGMSEEDSLYEDFHDVCWDVYLALLTQRSYTLTGADVTVRPVVTWNTFENRMVAGRACHTCEMILEIQINHEQDLS